MNYIKEINAFYDHMERNPLSASAVTLWHTLMHINNKARWAETFTVAAPVIRVKSGLTDSSFKRARIELKEKGYIDYQSRSRNQAPIYRMVRLSGEEEAELAGGGGYVLEGENRDQVRGDLSEVEVGDRPADEGVDHLANQSEGPLIKHKENRKKQNNRNAADSVVRFFRENFGVVSPYVSRELLYWSNNMGELVMYAMKRALDRGKTNWGYVRAILENWEKKGIRSVRDVQEEELRFRRGRLVRKGRGWVGVGRGKEEVVPEWFWERKQGIKAVKESAEEKTTLREVDKETKEIKKMLENLG
ncbi:DnaD domain-containing protein [Virgibacillus kimchii]